MKNNHYAVQLFQHRLIDWYTQNKRTFAWRETSSCFQLLVAEILLRRTGVQKAERAYCNIVGRFGTAKKMVNADLFWLEEELQPLGLIGRANTLVQMANSILSKFSGEVPGDYDSLLSIPGVGRYTANAVLCFHFGLKVPIVDGNVKRVYSRCFGYQSHKAPCADKKLWEFARELLPDTRFKEYNYGILDFSALVCKHTKLNCNLCAMHDICFQNNHSV